MKTQAKILIMALGLLLPFSLLRAQGVTAGVVGGVSTGSVRITEVGEGVNNVITGRNISGFSGGLFVMPHFGPVFLRPELVYNFRKGDIGTGDTQTDFKVHKIEVPVMVGLKVIGPLGLEAGPVYNYIARVETGNDSQLDIGKNGLGYRLGVIANFNKVFLNAGYQGVTYTRENSGGTVTTYKEPYKLMFGAGIGLGGGK